MKKLGFLLIAAFFAAAPAAAEPAGHPVLLISIDGLRPADILQARQRGLNLPNLSALLKQASFATAVHPPLASQTYPGHVTIITGAWPRQHGIAFNEFWDPQRTGSHMWRATDLKAPTLFDAVHKAGGLTANVGWPMTTGMASIDQNIPEYGRAQHPEQYVLTIPEITPGLLPRLVRETHIEFKDAFGLNPPNDDARSAYVAAMMGDFKPYFLAVHITSLDHAEHLYGPDARETRDTLEGLDRDVGVMVAAARKARPGIVIAIASDHGFYAIHNAVELGAAFVKAGLITLDSKGGIASWQAQPWAASGSFAVILARPHDAALKAKVLALLKTLAADPANGLGEIIGEQRIAELGGTALASFWVDCRLGYEPGPKLTGPLVAPPTQKGTHGYFPTHPEMYATFLVTGPGVTPGKSLGEIEMRDVAPTLARIMGVNLPSATGKPVL